MIVQQFLLLFFQQSFLLRFQIIEEVLKEVEKESIKVLNIEVKNFLKKVEDSLAAKTKEKESKEEKN